jgi:hypothetical protein
VIVVGNKRDLNDDRELSLLESSKLCQEQEVPLIEASAATGEVFTKLTRASMNKLDSGPLQMSMEYSLDLGDAKHVRDRMCSC